MWTLEMIEQEIKYACFALDIDYPDIPINKSNMKSFGKFVYWREGLKPKCFRFSNALLDGRFDNNFVTDVIQHEVCHYYANVYLRKNKRTKANKPHSCPYFLEACDMLGCNSKGGTDVSKIVDEKVAIEKSKYVIKCMDCGRLSFYSRLSKVVKYTDAYICGKCKGKLERIK